MEIVGARLMALKSVRFLPLLLGIFGAANEVLGLRLWWRVISSPGDGNPVGLLGLAVGVVALVPAYGLVLHARDEPLRSHVPWVVTATATSVVLAIVVPVLLALS